MITIDKENVMDIYEEMLPLLEAHFDEVGVYKEFTLDPEWNTYSCLEDEEDLVCYTVRDNGKLVGYVVYIMHPSLHYKDETFAEMDVIYLDPNYRGGTTAAQLLMDAEDYCYNHGATMITMRMKVYLAFETLAKDLSYDKMEYVYTKYLGD